MRRGALIAAGAVGAVAVVATVAWLVALRDSTTPVDVEEAVTSFRDETESEHIGSPIPVGVYVYATQGYEKTDALTGVTHRYPPRSTITVSAADCGMRLTWRVLNGRSTEWTYCQGSGGTLLLRQDERHTFFGRTERTTYDCEATVIRPSAPRLGMSWRGLDCGTDDTAERGVVRVVELAPVVVGDSRVDAVHVRKATRFSGSSRGTSRHDLWFDTETGLPLRLVMVSRTTSDSPIGDVSYEEDVTLALTSLEPRR